MNSLVRSGGLYRCCTQNIEELPVETVPEGSTMSCRYCGTPMQFTRNAWEWDEARDLKNRSENA